MMVMESTLAPVVLGSELLTIATETQRSSLLATVIDTSTTDQGTSSVSIAAHGDATIQSSTVASVTIQTTLISTSLTFVGAPTYASTSQSLPSTSPATKVSSAETSFAILSTNSLVTTSVEPTLSSTSVSIASTLSTETTNTPLSGLPQDQGTQQKSSITTPLLASIIPLVILVILGLALLVICRRRKRRRERKVDDAEISEVRRAQQGVESSVDPTQEDQSPDVVADTQHDGGGGSSSCGREKNRFIRRVLCDLYFCSTDHQSDTEGHSNGDVVPSSPDLTPRQPTPPPPPPPPPPLHHINESLRSSQIGIAITGGPLPPPPSATTDRVHSLETGSAETVIRHLPKSRRVLRSHSDPFMDPSPPTPTQHETDQLSGVQNNEAARSRDDEDNVVEDKSSVTNDTSKNNSGSSSNSSGSGGNASPMSNEGLTRNFIRALKREALQAQIAASEAEEKAKEMRSRSGPGPGPGPY